MIKLKTNLISGVFAICLGTVLLLIVPFQIQEELFLAQGQISADFIPRVISVIMIILGSMLLIQSLVLKQEKIVCIEIGAFKRGLAFLGLLVAYAILFSLIGFVISSVLFVVSLLLFQKCRNRLYWIICVLFPVVIYILFNYVFSVKLPLI